MVTDVPDNKTLYDHLMEEVPDAPFWEKFHSTYKPVQVLVYNAEARCSVCDRCRANVRPRDFDKHIEWHRDLTLGMFIHSSWISKVLEAWEGEE